MSGNCRNQIDVAVDIEIILSESGLKYEVAYDPKTNIYFFKLSNEEA